MVGLFTDDDKYAKASLTHERSFALRDVFKLSVLNRKPFHVYTCYVLTVLAVYHLFGGDLRNVMYEDKLGVMSCLLEALGLISLQQKIEKHGKVSGISGASMIMFALSYSLRECESLIMSKVIMSNLEATAVECLQISSVFLVFSITWSVFKTYKASYQEDLDVLKVKYLLPGCCIMGLLLHPFFVQGFFYDVCWTISFYIDILALLPQVVMMSRGGGKVEAPICHFVAATAVSRLIDLWFWYFRFDLGPQGYVLGFNYSGSLIVLCHFVNLGLIADFMYYYMKARLAGASISEDLALPIDDLC